MFHPISIASEPAGTLEEAFLEPEPSTVAMPESPIKAERKAVPKTTRARLLQSDSHLELPFGPSPRLTGPLIYILYIIYVIVNSYRLCVLHNTYININTIYLYKHVDYIIIYNV